MYQVKPQFSKNHLDDFLMIFDDFLFERLARKFPNQIGKTPDAHENFGFVILGSTYSARMLLGLGCSGSSCWAISLGSDLERVIKPTMAMACWLAR